MTCKLKGRLGNCRFGYYEKGELYLSLSENFFVRLSDKVIQRMKNLRYHKTILR